MLDTLLISEPDAAGNYTFTDSADSASDQKTLADMKETLGLQQYATANDVMEMLVEKNQLESFSLPWQRCWRASITRWTDRPFPT